MKSLGTVGAAALAFLLTFGGANAATITFDEFGDQPTTFSNQPDVLGDDYASEGITFSGGWEILHENGGFGVDAFSGNNFAAYNSGTPGITDALTVDFDSAIGSISAIMGSAFTRTWTISLFFEDALVNSFQTHNTAGAYTSFLTTGYFDRVSIQGSGLYGIVDNLSYEFAGVAEVPLPATGLLLLGPLGGLGLARRRTAS